MEAQGRGGGGVGLGEGAPGGAGGGHSEEVAGGEALEDGEEKIRLHRRPLTGGGGDGGGRCRLLLLGLGRPHCRRAVMVICWWFGLVFIEVGSALRYIEIDEELDSIFPFKV